MDLTEIVRVLLKSCRRRPIVQRRESRTELVFADGSAGREYADAVWRGLRVSND